MVRSLTIKFDSREFPNPHIQRHYDMLHALALEREAIDDLRDLICPDLEGMERAREKVIAFRDAVCWGVFCVIGGFDFYFFSLQTLGENYAFAPPPKAKKRKRDEGGGEEGAAAPPKKTAKKDKINPNDIDWWNMSEAQVYFDSLLSSSSFVFHLCSFVYL